MTSDEQPEHDYTEDTFWEFLKALKRQIIRRAKNTNVKHEPQETV
jgi:23S rRNA maturation mini-RNase III